MKKISFILAIAVLIMIIPVFCVPVHAGDYSGIIEQALGLRGNTSVWAGSSEGDWAAFAYGRHYNTPMENYISKISADVQGRYETKNKLSVAKSTEWHRIILAVLANGENPYIFTEENINLIADGTYNRGYTISLGRQGINGWIWGLIALDSLKTEVPADAYYTRETIITEIISQQTPDGGFALSGDSGDIDITANAITALAPYYGSNALYTYEMAKSGETVTKTIHQVIDESLEFISSSQLESGGFSSYGTENCESSSQVMIALCTMKINILTDDRFIKNENTIVDAILKYRNSDGGFSHLPEGKTNLYASDQAVIAFIALERFINGDTSIYDFSYFGFSDNKPAADPVENDNKSHESIFKNENSDQAFQNGANAENQQNTDAKDNNSYFDNYQSDKSIYYSETSVPQIYVNSTVTTAVTTVPYFIEPYIAKKQQNTSYVTDSINSYQVTVDSVTTVTDTKKNDDISKPQNSKSMLLFIYVPSISAVIGGFTLIVYQNLIVKKGN